MAPKSPAPYFPIKRRSRYHSDGTGPLFLGTAHRYTEVMLKDETSPPKRGDPHLQSQRLRRLRHEDRKLKPWLKIKGVGDAAGGKALVGSGPSAKRGRNSGAGRVKALRRRLGKAVLRLSSPCAAVGSGGSTAWDLLAPLPVVDGGGAGRG